ncbi:hypothetical protein [Schinkia azotoformans]|uniref:hypothetical protein n=1 Tax=Schinkia azotoformans TaxID=1454 RepID=UPI002DBE070B|nr:hypothetical protein [Schinkia azotoformans]MEC1714783.1 hypothetical protein [Schinkia azotoformans]MEC1757461.1 hypothetical protein [Schinkia azotoformans]
MLIDYRDFIIGALSAAMAYAFFKDNAELDADLEVDDEEMENDYEFEHNGESESSGRLVPMFCQTCRKLKKHREIERDLYQCTKCKRHVDLRKKSTSLYK